VRDLEAVVDAAGLKRFSLLGISQGGPIAITYAVRHPERVSRIILLGAYGRGYMKRNPTPAQVDEWRVLIDLMRIGWGRETTAFRHVFTSMFVPDGTPEQHRWFDELQRQSTSPENAARILAAFGELDVRELIPLVTAPTLVLHGDEDPLLLPKCGEATARAVREGGGRSELAILRGMGHDFPLEVLPGLAERVAAHCHAHA
jgi:pimeloyl-ACP methyl ester carboxylesterase